MVRATTQDKSTHTNLLHIMPQHHLVEDLSAAFANESVPQVNLAGLFPEQLVRRGEEARTYDSSISDVLVARGCAFLG